MRNIVALIVAGVPDRETTVEVNMDGVLGVEEANFENGFAVGH